MATWGVVFALILALFIANIRVFSVPLLSPFCQLYISFFRGTPLLVQLFLLYYGLPQIFPFLVGLNAFSAAVIGLLYISPLTWQKVFVPPLSVLIAVKWKQPINRNDQTSGNETSHLASSHTCRIALFDELLHRYDQINVISFYLRCCWNHG